MKLPDRSRFLHLAAGAAPNGVAHRLGADLSDATRALDRRLSAVWWVRARRHTLSRKGKDMSARLDVCLSAVSATVITLGMGSAAHGVELNPAAITIKLPDQIPWQAPTPAGNQNAVLVGNPDRPGFYIVLTKWLAGNHFSHPHFHPNDRFITVLKGTWWVGTGTKFDPNNGTVALPAGSFVAHYAKQVHYDGAKFEDTVLLIVGDGPATSVPAEEK